MSVIGVDDKHADKGLGVHRKRLVCVACRLMVMQTATLRQNSMFES